MWIKNIKKQISYLKDGMWTIPNLLSVVRILLIPVFIYLFYKGDILGAFIVILVSGFTDALDGLIARHFNQISNLGKLLDPLADKLNQVSIVIMLFIKFNSSNDKLIHSFSYVFIIFFVKEIIMVIGAVTLMMLGATPKSAEFYGKTATAVFYTVMILILAFGKNFGAFAAYYEMSDNLVIGFVILSAVLTIIALIAYIPDAIKQTKTKLNDMKLGEINE
ncbi:MAG: CDP-alcohol phosphatidyltransferase family protein [Clostridia bacterium]|nr:CDP-alcohol phosphatidyltransferase family protein [Clostridia bacterium]